ncbi:hypothetical protein ACFSHQ_07445 [Gemmobacter lanyuensis]
MTPRQLGGVSFWYADIGLPERRRPALAGIRRLMSSSSGRAILGFGRPITCARRSRACRFWCWKRNLRAMAPRGGMVAG